MKVLSVHSLVPVVHAGKTGSSASGSGPVLSLPFPFFPTPQTANTPIASLPSSLRSDDYDEARDVGSPLSLEQLDSAKEQRISFESPFCLDTPSNSELLFVTQGHRAPGCIPQIVVIPDAI